MQFILILLLLVLGQAEDFQRIEVFGNMSIAYYYSKFYFGEPLQAQTLLLDTGSYLTVLTCSNCRICDTQRLQSLYNPERSFSHAAIKCGSRQSICRDKCKRNSQNCEFFINYLDGSNVMGNIISDYFGLSDDAQTNPPVKAFFGCIDFEKTQKLAVNGLIGLGHNPTENVLYKWFEEKSSRSFEFSFCLGYNGGYLEIGRSPEQVQPEHTFNFDASKSFYEIMEVSSITYGKLNVLNQNAIRANGLIMDTGSTGTLFPKAIASKIFAEVINSCDRMRRGCTTAESWADNGCFFFDFKSKDRVERMKELDGNFQKFTFVINGQTLEWWPRYQFQVMESTYVEGYGYAVCSMIIASQDRDRYILGDNWLTGRRVNVNIQKKTLNIVSDQTCKYEPYVPKQSSGEYLQHILAEASAFFEAYAIVIAGAVIFLLVCFKEKIGKCITRLKKKLGLLEQEKTEMDESSISDKNKIEMVNQNSVLESQPEETQKQGQLSEK